MAIVRDLGMIEKVTIMNNALSSPQRMRIMKVLGSAEEKTLGVGDIAEILDMAQPTCTKHLQILHQAGFVTRTKVGSKVFYSDDERGSILYRNLIDCAFEARKSKCVNEWDCETCPQAGNCNTNFPY